MKITEKTAQETIVRNLPLERGIDVIAKSLQPTEPDEPISIIYVRSGWNYGYPTFHVLIEYGDMEQTEYKFMSLDEMVEKFGVTAEKIMEDKTPLIRKHHVLEHPNDTDLGKFVRSQFK